MNGFLKSILGAQPLRIIDMDYDEEYWPKLKVVRVEVWIPTSVAQRPLSTKQLQEAELYYDALEVDVRNAKVIQPVAMKVVARADDLSTVESILQIFQDKQASFSITSKDIIADAMCPINVLLTQSPDRLNVVEVEMEFEQYDRAVLTDFDPRNAQDSNTFGVNVQELKDKLPFDIDAAKNSVTSAAKSLYNKVSSLLPTG